MSHNDAANNASNSVNKQQWLYLNGNKNNKINRCLFVVFSYYEFYLAYSQEKHLYRNWHCKKESMMNLTRPKMPPNFPSIY